MDDSCSGSGSLKDILTVLQIYSQAVTDSLFLNHLFLNHLFFNHLFCNHLLLKH